MSAAKSIDRRASDLDAMTIRAYALADELEELVSWAEEHRRAAKAAGERPCIDAHRVNRAKAALKRAGR